MSVASNSLRGVPLEKRPYGFLFVNTWRSRCIVHDCEIEFRDRNVALSLTCQIMDIKRASRSYSLLLFEDEERSKHLMFATVGFFDGSAASAHYKSACVDKRIKCFELVIIRMLHAIIFHNIVIDRAPFKRGSDREKESVWYSGFTPEVAHSLDGSAGIGIPLFTKSLVDLLRA